MKKILLLFFFYYSPIVFGMESVSHSEKIVITHQDFHYFLWEENLYNLHDEFNNGATGEQIKQDIASIFSLVREEEISWQPGDSLFSLFKEIMIKNSTDYGGDKLFISKLSNLPQNQLKKIKSKETALEIISGIEEIINSYFDDTFLAIRQKAEEIHIPNEPYFTVVIGYTPDGSIEIIGAPGANRKMLYSKEFDYDKLSHNSIGYFSKLLILTVGFLSLIISQVPVKFPSFTNHWSNQSMADLDREFSLRAIGLNNGATTEEIKSTCRELVLKHHPDKSNEQGAAKQYQHIWENCQILKEKK